MNQFWRALPRLAATAAAVLAFAFGAMPAWAEDAAPVETSAEAYLVMDVDTGQTILEKNADESLYPASIVKIMVLGLACEKAQGDWSTELTVSQEVIDYLEREAAHVALLPGEVVHLEDLLYATCMQSACDAANMLAIYVGGSVEGGIRAMNDKAAELGLTDTVFTNPTGLFDAGTVTTARDMAVITRWAMQQPGFPDVFGRSDVWIMQPTNLQPMRYFHTDDHLRLPGYTVYRTYAKGSKSGWHDQAQYTQVAWAEKDGVNVIAVLLRSATRAQKFEEMAALFDYTFSHFQQVEIPLTAASATVGVWGGGGQLGAVTVSAPPSVKLLLETGRSLETLTPQLEAPQQYVIGAGLRPQLTVSLDGTGTQAASRFSVEPVISGMEAVMEENRGAPSEKPFPFLPFLLAGLVAAAAVFGARWLQRPRVRRAVQDAAFDSPFVVDATRRSRLPEEGRRSPARRRAREDPRRIYRQS